MPHATPDAVEQIVAAARQLYRLREGGVRAEGTMTRLYNKRPAWLERAHVGLDAAVHTAYGWPYPLDDDEILTRLLALNLDRKPGAATDKVDDDEDVLADPTLDES